MRFQSITPQLNQEYVDLIEQCNGAEADRRAAWNYMKASTAIWDGVPIYSGFIPKIFDTGTLERLDNIATTTYHIIEKVINHYCESSDYRKLFGFDPRMEELILLPNQTDCLLPWARVDVFLNEETGEATFCEFNSDGSSGMNENREVFASIKDSTPYLEFSKRHSLHHCNGTFFEAWIDEFQKIYATYPNAVEHPHVAILDYLENAALEEFKVYVDLFKRAGIDCSIYDIRNLTFENRKLIGHDEYTGKPDTPIDAIWRRSVSVDILEHWDESHAFLDAIRNNDVCLIGTYKGHIVHDKRLFSVLPLPETQAILTNEENEFLQELLPATSFLQSDVLSEDRLAEIKANRNDWILKPTDGYCSHGVMPGANYTQEEWVKLVDCHLDGKSGVPYLVQKFCRPYTTPAIAFYNHEEDYTKSPSPYKNMEGLYLINGKFSAVYTRLGPNPIILGKYGGITEAGVYVDADDFISAHGWKD